MAADSEQDMRDWVMVICQVCNLQETEEKTSGDSEAVQCKIIQFYVINQINNSIKIIFRS